MFLLSPTDYLRPGAKAAVVVILIHVVQWMRLVVFNKPGTIISSLPFIRGWTLIQFPKCYDSQDIVRWAKSKISIIASVMYRCQNPLESMYLYFAYQHLMAERLNTTFNQMEDIFFILRVTKLHFIVNSSDILFLYPFWTFISFMPKFTERSKKAREIRTNEQSQVCPIYCQSY
jgi:hypothetical protein